MRQLNRKKQNSRRPGRERAFVVRTKSKRKLVVEPKVVLNYDHFLSQFVSLIVEVYKPQRVLLFGSRARGESKKDSDYDIVVLTQREVGWQRRVKFARLRSELQLNEAADLVFWTEKYFRERVHLRASMVSEVAAEGRVLYEAA